MIADALQVVGALLATVAIGFLFGLWWGVLLAAVALIAFSLAMEL